MFQKILFDMLFKLTIQRVDILCHVRFVINSICKMVSSPEISQVLRSTEAAQHDLYAWNAHKRTFIDAAYRWIISQFADKNIHPFRCKIWDVFCAQASL